MASTIAKFGLTSTPTLPSLNTRTLIDIAVGEFIIGEDCKYILNGGIDPMTAIVGRPGTYKSTTADSLIAALFHIYPQIETIKYDTENNAFGLSRMSKISGIKEIELKKQFVLKNRTELNLIEFDDMIKDICREREDNKKNYLIDTPFINDNGDGFAQMYVPLVIDFDSFSNAESVKTELSGTADKVSAEDSSHNMDYMFDGGVKTRLISKYANLSHKYSIYFIFTAHVGEAFNLDPRNPAPKQHQYMKQLEKIKRCGAQFGYLTNMVFQMISPVILKTKVNEGYECTYPVLGSTETELNVVPARVIRCKKNHAGTDVPLVISQDGGILSDLSNYHYLKSEKWGLTGSDRSPRSAFHSDVGLGRKEVRDKLKDNYELCRGLEILAQLKFIEQNWTNFPFNIPKDAETFIEQIAKNSTYKIDDILNSRGYWTYGEKAKERPYMSVMDILTILNK